MDTDEIQPFQESVGAVGKKFVAGVGGGTRPADQHYDTCLISRRLNSLGHVREHVTVTRNGPLPILKWRRLPWLIPQFYRVELPFGQP